MNNNKIAIYTGDLSYSTAKGIISIVSSRVNIEVMVFVNHKKTPPKKKLILQWNNIKKNGLYRFTEVINIAARVFYSKILARSYSHVGGDAIPDYVAQVKQHNSISICNVIDINGKDSVEKIKLFNPVIGVSIAAPILKKQVIDIAELGNLNLHKGKLPSYRGMPPAFWEVKNGEKTVGCSIHFISELLDEGDLILESEVKIEKWSTPKGLQIQLDELGVGLMTQAICLLLSGNHQKIKQKGIAKTYSKPSLKENLVLLESVQCKDRNFIVKKVIKNLVFSLYSHTYAPVRSLIKGLLGKQDIIILLYHRVNDYQRDSLTVGVEQFSEQMAYVNQRFPTASLKSLIKGEVSRFEKKPIIIVSFDDGYIDNYENAFPICLRNKIPCSFFVSTEMIDTGKSFPHDHRLDRRLFNMSWEQLTEMKDSGMFIGSHTCEHINCATTESTQLMHELKHSQDVLNAKLGDDIAILAYPFGGQEHFNRRAEKQAVDAGYQAILSAYGGVNSNINLLDLKRGGVDWMFNKRAFKATLFGWKR